MLIIIQAVVSIKVELNRPALLFRCYHNRWRDTGFRGKPRSHPSASDIGPVLRNAICYLEPVCFYLSEWFIVREMWCQLPLPHHQSCFIKVNSVWLAEISYWGNPRKPLLAVIFPAVKAPNGCNNCLTLLGRRRRRKKKLSAWLDLNAPWIHEA